MLRSTLSILRCPRMKKQAACQGRLDLSTHDTAEEVLYGELFCEKCKSNFPILEGVALLVNDVRVYLLTHVKGVSKFVPDEKIPKKYRDEYLEYKAEIEEEHIEEDLESDRVNALYLMNHYLDSKQMVEKTKDPLIQDLLSKYWDQSPFSSVQKWIPDQANVVELGCGVGGFYHFISNCAKSYLGVDSSFQSVLIARHLNLGLAYPGELKTPKDLLQGNLSEKFNPTFEKNKNQAQVDFIVGDIDALPLALNHFDVSVSLNAIDMLEEPKLLPLHQKLSLKPGGIAIQSGPYIWHEQIARKLRAALPKTIHESGKAVEWLYENAGFKILETKDHLPWLFFKHGRQLELYSVHLFKAFKPLI